MECTSTTNPRARLASSPRRSSASWGQGIVEYARAEPPRDALHTLQGGRHQTAQDARRLHRLTEILRLVDRFETDQERGQGLGRLIVQLRGQYVARSASCAVSTSFNSARDRFLGVPALGDVAVDADVPEPLTVAVEERRRPRFDVDALTVLSAMRQLALKPACFQQPLIASDRSTPTKSVRNTRASGRPSTSSARFP